MTPALRPVVVGGLDARARGVVDFVCFVGLFGFIDFTTVDVDASPIGLDFGSSAIGADSGAFATGIDASAAGFDFDAS